MGRAENRELSEYFKDRNVWMLEPDRKPLKLVRYDSAGVDPSP